MFVWDFLVPIMRKGSIKINNSIQDTFVFTKPQYLYWWTLIKFESHKLGRTYMVGNEQKELAKGQLCMSYRGYGQLLNCTDKTAKNFIEKLQEAGLIKTQDSAHNSAHNSAPTKLVFTGDYAGFLKAHSAHNSALISAPYCVDVDGKEYTEEELYEKYKKFVSYFVKETGNTYAAKKEDLKNFKYWLGHYTNRQIAQAVKNFDDTFWADDLTPQLLFRQKSRNQDSVDYIGQLLNHKPKQKELV